MNNTTAFFQNLISIKVHFFRFLLLTFFQAYNIIKTLKTAPKSRFYSSFYFYKKVYFFGIFLFFCDFFGKNLTILLRKITSKAH